MIKENQIYRKLLTFALLITGVFILFTEMPPNINYFMNTQLEDVSCYNVFGVGLTVVAAKKFYPPGKSIFFHETSCRGGLNSRQACAVESAARIHEDWNVYVLFPGLVTDYNSLSFRALRQFKNVKLVRINLSNYANRTDLMKFVQSGALKKTRWRVAHISDLLRYLTLYKYGGIYLDLETIVAKPLDELNDNWSVRQSNDVVASGAMAFSRDDVGRTFAQAAISDLAKNFRGDAWNHNGPGVITRVLQEKCGTQNPANMSADVCQGFEVYGPELFYPISYNEADRHIESGETSETPYVYHMWNGVTQFNEVANSSLYVKLARTYCPSVYNSYGLEFGK